MSEINELMDRDPLSLTEENIRTIISAYRDMRYKFNLGDTKAGSIKPRAKPAALKGMDDDSLESALGKITL